MADSYHRLAAPDPPRPRLLGSHFYRLEYLAEEAILMGYFAFPNNRME